jgi:aminoglycoside/choline kinase family phosphotransferase
MSTVNAERRTDDGADVRTRIDEFLNERGLAGAHVVPLTGDASDRRYFRIILGDDGTQVLAVHPGAIDFAKMPFVKVAELFSLLPVPVPAILSFSDALGIIGLEDLGDVTLQAHLGAATPAEHKALYRQAVSLIEAMQRRGAAMESPEYPPYGIAFDVAKLTWELDFFARHFLEGYRGITLDPAVRTALAGEFSSIVEELAAEPRVLCHRDYHSRNLMLHQGSLYIIDFQDARMGPDTYDLVSLLRDSYVDLAESEVDDLIAFFLALRHAPGGPGTPGTLEEFRRRFDLMAIQRNLKALGTFGFQTISRGNPVYIQYIPRTLNYVRANLERYPRFGRLRELLAAHVEELRQ